MAAREDMVDLLNRQLAITAASPSPPVGLDAKLLKPVFLRQAGVHAAGGNRRSAPGFERG